jgi:hypothetical protein
MARSVFVGVQSEECGMMFEVKHCYNKFVLASFTQQSDARRSPRCGPKAVHSQ